jgi:molybdopterin-guanine dinucleotide biosynthesis protein A
MSGARRYPSKSVAGIVLAGGRSRRMGGRDKAQLLLDGRSMLAMVIDRLRPQVGALAVSSNGDAIRLLQPDLTVLDDAEFSYEGPLAGILAGMRWARREMPSANWITTVATDTPFLPLSLVQRLLTASPRSAVARLAASRGRVHPVLGLWPIELGPALEKWLADGASRKVRDWIESIPRVVVTFDDVDGIDPFFNVNTAEDANVARSLLSEIAS